jgi:hypothetical protein
MAKRGNYIESEYSKKLRDPRWQKKRLQIMERDDFRCQVCFDDEVTLNVHHGFYKKVNEPWDYPDSSLVTLCEDCHQVETETAYSEKQMLVEVLSIVGFLASDFNNLGSSIYEAKIRGNFEIGVGDIVGHTVSAVAWAICDPDVRDYLQRAYQEHLKIRREASKVKESANASS